MIVFGNGGFLNPKQCQANCHDCQNRREQTFITMAIYVHDRAPELEFKGNQGEIAQQWKGKNYWEDQKTQRFRSEAKGEPRFLEGSIAYGDN